MEKAYEKTYYQPIAYMDNGIDIRWGDIPEEMWDFQAFATKEICRDWLWQHGYDDEDFAIIEYHDDDIEGVQLIDEYGDDYE